MRKSADTMALREYGRRRLGSKGCSGLQLHRDRNVQPTEPSIRESVPAAHSSQLCAPSLAEKRPAGQGVQ